MYVLKCGHKEQYNFTLYPTLDHLNYYFLSLSLYVCLTPHPRSVSVDCRVNCLTSKTHHHRVNYHTPGAIPIASLLALRLSLTPVISSRMDLS